MTTTLSTTTWPSAASDCSRTTTEHNHWWREPQATSSEEHFKKARFCTTTASSRGATTATTGYSSRSSLLSKEALTKSTKESSPSESLGLDPASKNSASGGHGRGSVSSWRSPSAPASGVGRQCHDAPHLGLVELAVSLCGDLDREKLEVHLLEIVGQHGAHQGQPRPSL